MLAIPDMGISSSEIDRLMKEDARLRGKITVASASYWGVKTKKTRIRATTTGSSVIAARSFQYLNTTPKKDRGGIK
jgi:hypothetical protein